jgi:superfamily I DNA/RNA helicase
VFVRSEAELAARKAAVAARRPRAFKVLDERSGPPPATVAISTMHLAKGLEFRAVAVMACDDEVIPLQERIERSATTPTSRRSTTPSGTCSTSPARGRGTTCW